MAYYRRYWRRYWRRYYRGRYSSLSKTRMSRNFKASANNMTQGGTFNVSVIKERPITIADGAKVGIETQFDLASWISGSDMHRYLSNVFDQYRVEKVSIKIRPVGDSSSTITQPSLLFTCVDRSGFAQTVTHDTLRTYGSYKETLISGAKDVSPVHYVNIGQSNLVEFSSYTDSKSKVSFPSMAVGVAYASGVEGGLTAYVSIEIDAQIRYRGVRLDTSAVSTSV